MGYFMFRWPCPGQFASEGCFSLTRPRAGSGSQFSGLRSGAGAARGSRAGESLTFGLTVAGGGLGPAGRVTCDKPRIVGYLVSRAVGYLVSRVLLIVKTPVLLATW